MEVHPVTMIESTALPEGPTPALVHIPEWEQFPPEKREELTNILAGMLIRQVQEVRGKHEQPS